MPRGSAVLELAIVWLVAVTALVYLDVPLQHAVLFAANLVLQASLGGLVIVRLMKRVAPSLLLLCGPGLILGGALSFAIFQVVGRGALGVVATAGIGIAATLLLVRMRLANLSLTSRWWLLGQLVGMAMLGLAGEFTELLPVAAALFVLGFVNSEGSRLSGGLKTLLNVAALAALCLLTLMRAKYWWLVTDDYQLLEVISNHLTTSGPFAAWGVDSFARYHWLSYGWSGFLNVSSGGPAPLVTLTRVMPFVYSLSMASSIVLLLVRLSRHSLQMWSILPAWFVVAVGRFDWSGTSTGGAYATLAAFLVVSVIVLQSRTRLSRSLVVVLMFALIVALTKLPSVFVVGLLVITGLVTIIASSPKTAWASLAVKIFGSIVTISALLAGVWIFSRLLDQRVRFSVVNPALGQLATLRADLVGLVLLLNQLWLWLTVAYVVATRLRSSGRDAIHGWLSWAVSVALIMGLVFELSLTSNADNHTYFSGPMYFLASFAALLPGAFYPTSATPRIRKSAPLVASFLIAGIVWSIGDVALTVWMLCLQPFTSSADRGSELLRFFTSDGRFGATVLAAFVGVVVFTVRRKTPEIAALIPALVVLTFFNNARHSYVDYVRAVPNIQVEANLGTEQERRVGLWLGENSDPSNVIATNRLFGDDGGAVSDLGLAMWSRREFLVLGPQLGYGASPARRAAIELSRAFADRPSRLLCDQLLSRGVRWFVVDRRIAAAGDWSVCGTERYSFGDLSVFYLASGNAGS